MGEKVNFRVHLQPEIAIDIGGLAPGQNCGRSGQQKISRRKTRVMATTENHNSSPTLGVVIAPQHQAAVRLLLEASEDAQRVHCPIRELAVKRRRLMLNEFPAEMLLSLGAAGLVLVDDEDVVLTPQGLAWARDLGGGIPEGAAALPAAFGFPLPFFNEKDHELWYDGGLVKRLREDAGNQAVILSAFQESMWRRCIPNPLPNDAEVDRQEQFRDAVRRLNSSQGKRHIRFSRKNTVSTVHWEEG